jgi:hypothetical protein
MESQTESNEMVRSFLTTFSNIMSPKLQEILSDSGHTIPLDVLQASISKLSRFFTNGTISENSSSERSESSVKKLKKPMTKKYQKQETVTTKRQCSYVYIRGPKSGKQCEKFASKDSEFCVSCKNTKNTKKRIEKKKSENSGDDNSTPKRSKKECEDVEISKKPVDIQAKDWDIEKNLLLEKHGFILTTTASGDVVAVGMLNQETSEVEPLTEEEKKKAEELGLLVVPVRIPQANAASKKIDIDTMFDDSIIPSVPDLV